MNIGILTIIDNNNYGNRLQNYATQVIIKKMGFNVETIKNDAYSNTKQYYILRVLKNRLRRKSDYNSKRYTVIKS